MDANQGDKENQEYRCRVVAKEIKKDKLEDVFAAAPMTSQHRGRAETWAGFVEWHKSGWR